MADNEVIVDKLPYCDLHKAKGEFVIATYDARTKPSSPGRGSWAYLCGTHFERDAVGLGVGFGQRLIEKRPEFDGS